MPIWGSISYIIQQTGIYADMGQYKVYYTTDWDIC